MPWLFSSCVNPQLGCSRPQTSSLLAVTHCVPFLTPFRSTRTVTAARRLRNSHTATAIHTRCDQNSIAVVRHESLTRDNAWDPATAPDLAIIAVAVVEIGRSPSGGVKIGHGRTVAHDRTNANAAHTERRVSHLQQANGDHSLLVALNSSRGEHRKEQDQEDLLHGGSTIPPPS